MNYETKKITLLIIGIPLALIFLLAVYLFVVVPEMKRRTIAQESVQASPAESALPEESPALKQSPSAEGVEDFINTELSYAFSYPAGDVLLPCADIPCASIQRFTLSVQPLYASDISLTDPRGSLMKSDLLCSADGPNGSISCKNLSVETFTNGDGTMGYKISREKTVTGTGEIPAGTYSDVVYAFLFPSIKDVGGNQYVGMMFSVDNPTADNLGDLQMVARSFRIL